VELACLDDGHQVVRVLQHGDVGERVAVDDEQVGPLSGFDGSGLGGDAEEFGVGLGGGDQGLVCAER
jgi:hypothetical protein